MAKGLRVRAGALRLSALAARTPRRGDRAVQRHPRLHHVRGQLEGLTKEGPYRLYVSELTKIRIRDPALMDSLVRVGELEVRGREGTITAWTLPGLENA